VTRQAPHLEFPIEEYNKFKSRFAQLTKVVGKEQYIVPYLISSHPGSTLNHAIEMALYLKRNNLNPEQVQDFYPTPGTASTCMFYTGIDPATGKEVYVARDYEEKQMQRALLQFARPANAPIVRKALKKAGREDLIGFGNDCLVRPEPPKRFGNKTSNIKGKADNKKAPSKNKASKPQLKSKKRK